MDWDGEDAGGGGSLGDIPAGGGQGVASAENL